MSMLSDKWFARDATEVARDLLGKRVRRGSCEGVIVETEAYTTDAASHARTLTPRSRLMHETCGRWYVYFSYGMHYCVNVTTNPGGAGAVLIRAVEPTAGLSVMKKHRKTNEVRDLCSGPGKLCQAFGITRKENGLPMSKSFAILDAPPVPAAEISRGSRIGIRRAQELPWRFWIAGNPYVSRK